MMEDETWTKEGPNKVLQAAGTKPLREYIDKRQVKVLEWLALRPIFEVYAKETGWAGGRKLCETWWCKEAADKQLGDTLKNILDALR